MPREKLEGYLLNPGHEIGRHKARVFAAALGLGHRDWEYLRDQLLARVVDAPVRSVRESPWGQLYEVEIRVEALNARVRPVTTVWLVAGEDEPPTLVTAYVTGTEGSA